MSSILEGVKVIECGIWIQGPYAAMTLGDLGADVIKVESRLGGDPIRGLLDWTLDGSQTKIKETDRNYCHEFMNRNKRSIALDLNKREGREVIYRLIEKADVFIHNWRLDVPEKLGVDYETLSRYNPRLIYAQGSGWGTKGPLKNRPSFEQAAMARSGWMYVFGGPEMPPLLFLPTIGDVIGGTQMAMAILAALFYREREGIGQFVDTSLFGSMIRLVGSPTNYRLVYGEEYSRRDREKATNPLANLYKCQDDKWIYLALMQSDRYWSDFCRVMGLDEHDPRFVDSKARRQNHKALIGILDKIFSTKSRDMWTKILEENEDFVFGPVQTFSEVVSDPQVLENEYVMEFDDPSFGRRKVVGFPSKFSKSPASIGMPAPEHGQHTEEVLLEIGYTWDEIGRLKDLEVII